MTPYNYEEQNGNFYDSQQWPMSMLCDCAGFIHDDALHAGIMPHFTGVVCFLGSESKTAQ